MKRLIFTLILLLTITSGIAQENDPIPDHKNEAGIDATSFVKNIFDFGGHGLATYFPPYLLNYRRYLKSTSFRVLMGGNYYRDDFPSPFSNGPGHFTESSGYLTTKIGYEWITNLGNRWQVYFGPIIQFNYLKETDDAESYSGGYALGKEITSTDIGIGPLAGFRFYLNDRLSLSTEGDLLFLFETVKSEGTVIPVSPTGPKPSVADPTTRKRYYTEFFPPLSLYVNFNF